MCGRFAMDKCVGFIRNRCNIPYWASEPPVDQQFTCVDTRHAIRVVVTSESTKFPIATHARRDVL